MAHLDSGGRWDAAGIEMTATSEADGFVLEGAKYFVIDGHTADTLIVVARTKPSSSGSESISLFLLPADTDGIESRRVETMDQTRKQAEITFTAVRVPATAVLGDPGSGWSRLQETLQRAVVALAFEQVGGAQQCLDTSVEYAKARIQFGRPIGSFQAIKHKCADMLVAIESARSAAYYAGWAAAVGDDDLAIAAPLAKSYCSEAYLQAAGDNIQIHGGIGFTWEHDAHLFFKRAKTDELLFGAPADHRAALAGALGL